MRFPSGQRPGTQLGRRLHFRRPPPRPDRLPVDLVQRRLNLDSDRPAIRAGDLLAARSRPRKLVGPSVLVSSSSRASPSSDPHPFRLGPPAPDHFPAPGPPARAAPSTPFSEFRIPLRPVQPLSPARRASVASRSTTARWAPCAATRAGQSNFRDHFSIIPLLLPSFAPTAARDRSGPMPRYALKAANAFVALPRLLFKHAQSAYDRLLRVIGIHPPRSRWRPGR